MSGLSFIHPTADVSPKSVIGGGTKIWHYCQVREGAILGENCSLGRGVYIDTGVIIGNNVKIQNDVSVYQGVTLEDGVFCGPHCVFSNDKRPRSIKPDGTIKSSSDWILSKTKVCYGASIGAQAVIVCGIVVGRWAMVGAGSVVTRDVPDYGLVYGNPSRLKGFVCSCGNKLSSISMTLKDDRTILVCQKCFEQAEIPSEIYSKMVQQKFGTE